MAASAGALPLRVTRKGHPAARCLADLADLAAPKPVPPRLARLPGLSCGAGSVVLSEEGSLSPREPSRELMLASESPCMVPPDRAPPSWGFSSLRCLLGACCWRLDLLSGAESGLYMLWGFAGGLRLLLRLCWAAWDLAIPAQDWC